MKLTENGVALTKRDLLLRCNQMEKALGTQAQKADALAKENDRLLAEVIRLNQVCAAFTPGVTPPE